MVKHLPKGIPPEDARNDVEKILSVDENVLSRFIESFNVREGVFSFVDFTKQHDIPLQSVSLLRSVLGYYAHRMYAHRSTLEELEKTFLEIGLDKDKVDRFIGILKRVNETAKDRLNTDYEAGASTGGDPDINMVSGEVMVREVLDDNNEFIGFLPLIRLEVSFTDIRGETSKVVVFHRFASYELILEYLKEIYSDSQESLERLKRQLGDKLIT